MSAHERTPKGLEKVLGPSGYEVSCDRCFELLDRYVDLELEGNDADASLPGMQAHLAGCPACQEDYQSLRAFVGGDATDPSSARDG